MGEGKISGGDTPATVAATGEKRVPIPETVLRVEDASPRTAVVNIRFRHGGRTTSFYPGDLNLRKGEKVVVETSRGKELGEVILGSRVLPVPGVGQTLRSVLRRATEADIALEEEVWNQSQEALKVAKAKAVELKLAMNLVRAEGTLDKSRMTFYFTAENRVDFRELVKILATGFHTRIELRQIGVRDEARFLGGLGPCGRIICCHSFLGEFAPVSIKMAKGQNVALNPGKISGICGRLMCCLRYEAYGDEGGRVATAASKPEEEGCPSCPKGGCSADRVASPISKGNDNKDAGKASR